MNRGKGASGNVRRIGLQSLIVSIVVSAALAIFSLLRGDFGETDGKILATALSVAAVSTLILANGFVLEKGQSPAISYPAILASVIGFSVLVAGMWVEVDSDSYWQATASIVVAGMALTHWALVSLVRVPDRHRWIQVIAYPLIGTLAVFVIAAIWGWIEGAAIAQLGGIVTVLTVSVSIILPVLQRLNRDELAERRRIYFCPFCGESLDAETGGVTCSSCDAAFRIHPA